MLLGVQQVNKVGSYSSWRPTPLSPSEEEPRVLQSRQVELVLCSMAPLRSPKLFAFPETGSPGCQSNLRVPGFSAMALRKELLKSIWYAFTALDVEKSGKVSKSQLKVRQRPP